MATSLLNINIEKCSHFQGINKICPFSNERTIVDIFNDLHGNGNFDDIKNMKSNVTDMLTVFGSSTSSMSSPTSKLLPELGIHMFVADIVQFGIVTKDDIDICKRHLTELFPELNLQKIQKNLINYNL